MALFTNLRSDRLITLIKSTDKPLAEETLKAVAKLKGLGPGVIEPVIESLADADKNATVALVDVLSTLVSNKTFPRFLTGLCDGNARIAAGIAWALTSSRTYSPSLLLDALNTKGVSKSSVLDVIHAQRERFNLRDLLNAAYAQEPQEKAALFRVIAEVADENSTPELVSRLEGKDPIARVHIINILSPVQPAGHQARAAGATARQQQDDPLHHAGGAGAHGRSDRRRGGVPAAQGRRDRCAESRHRRADPRQ